MVSQDGRFVVVFNGCIYNFVELRQELEGLGHHFRTSSDTEVLLEAFRAWGAECVHRFNGMWAFAVHDSGTGRTFLSRDRLGVKPLYFCRTKGGVCFSSEIKAILASGMIPAMPNLDAIGEYLRFQYCLQEKTFFQGISRLEPGCNLEIDPSGACRVMRYWSVGDSPRSDGGDVCERILSLSTDAVRIRLRSDVPVGAYLSGGLDSSFVVALMRQELPPNAEIRTFTGRFDEGPAFDESAYARMVSESADTIGHQYTITCADFVSSFEKMLWHLDEPVAGPGAIAQYMVNSQMAGKVRVVLGGQGGDELFLGYVRYLLAYLDPSIGPLATATTSKDEREKLLLDLSCRIPELATYMPLMRHFWEGGGGGRVSDRYFRLIDRMPDAVDILSPDWSGHLEGAKETFEDLWSSIRADDVLTRITQFEIPTQLAALLQVEDRMSMAWGIESRLPLLDYRLFEYVSGLPTEMKIGSGRLKQKLRDVAREILPGPVVDRTDKMGFPVPFNQWAAGSAAEYVQDMLGSRKARTRGIFNPNAYAGMMQPGNHFGRSLWGALCVETWFSIFIDGQS